MQHFFCLPCRTSIVSVEVTHRLTHTIYLLDFPLEWHLNIFMMINNICFLIQNSWQYCDHHCIQGIKAHWRGWFYLVTLLSTLRQGFTQMNELILFYSQSLIVKSVFSLYLSWQQERTVFALTSLRRALILLISVSASSFTGSSRRNFLITSSCSSSW